MSAHMAQSLSDETERYLEEKHIPQLVEHLYHELLLAMPSDPLAHLVTLLDRRVVPRIIIAGAPASGKGTQCEQIKAKYGVVHVSTGDLLRDEAARGTPLGRQAQQFMSQGALVPDALITQVVKDRLAREDVVANGWLLDGFPRTRAQALSLQQSGIIPASFLVLDVPDEVVVARISGRRVDPKTGNTYHIDFSPPPPGVEVVQRADDTADAIVTRLRYFHKNTEEVLQCYSALAVHIDGNRDKNEVFKDVSEIIDAKLSN